MPGAFDNLDGSFTLFRSPHSPAWRPPQAAALGAALAQWSLAGSEAPLVSVPTGVGKTAIAMAAPFLVGAKRVLVVVPTNALRKQIAAQFRSLQVLRDIGALEDGGSVSPSVVEVAGRSSAWERFKGVDVAVAIPASISPSHFLDAPPPPDLFDLVIVDEAHHAPAKTWAAIVDHFDAKALLLTATPHRRDGRRLPGRLVYYFPLRQALDEGLYKPIQPVLLPITRNISRDEIDDLIVAETAERLELPEHATSQFLVRAATKERAQMLAQKYLLAGHGLPVLHSGLGKKRQKEIVDGVLDGTYRGVAMVGMLVEGFDLPSLRIAAYHDKHKTIEPTAQLMGRLARVNRNFPQEAVLVAAMDGDAYPALKGVIRNLYEEDVDWATILPGIIDDVIEADQENLEYARSFNPTGGTVDAASLFPLRRAIVLKSSIRVGPLPPFKSGVVPKEVRVGEVFARRPVRFSAMSPDGRTLIVVTGAPGSPPWHRGEGLESMEYELHLISYRAAPTNAQEDLVFVNSESKRALTSLLECVGLLQHVVQGDPDRIQGIIDSKDRQSVSSVGVRNGFGATRGAPTYKMFAGSSIGGGLRDSDTAQGALGHAMVQIADEAGSFTAGISTGKGKYWETRYSPLRLYEGFLDDLADRYWGPASPLNARLLPAIRRGERLVQWPQAPVLAALFDPVLLGRDFVVVGHGAVDFLDLHAGADAVASGAPRPNSGAECPISISTTGPTGSTLIWTGEVGLDGAINATGANLRLQRGFSNSVPLEDALSEAPPTLLYMDGSSTRGIEFFPTSRPRDEVPPDLIEACNWVGVNIRTETPRAAAAAGAGISIHEWVEAHLARRPRRSRHRWILNNDGRGEIADHIVLELLPNGQVIVELWHSKFAGGPNPGVRVNDFEVVVAQAIKSRRWPSDRNFWAVLAERYSGGYPPLRLVDGSARTLKVVLGLVAGRWTGFSLAQRRPTPEVLIGIVQPGLGEADMRAQLAEENLSALQIAQLLTVFHDAVHSISDSVVLTSG